MASPLPYSSKSNTRRFCNSPKYCCTRTKILRSIPLFRRLTWARSNPSEQDCDRSGYPYFGGYTGPYVNPWTNTNDSAASRCSTVFDSELSSWLATAPITNALGTSTGLTEWDAGPTTDNYYPTVAAGSTVQVVSGTTTTVSWTSGAFIMYEYPPHSSVYVSNFDYTPSAPCCSSCTVYGGTVQVFQWPTATATPTATPAVSLLVDIVNNFTLYVCLIQDW